MLNAMAGNRKNTLIKTMYEDKLINRFSIDIFCANHKKSKFEFFMRQEKYFISFKNIHIILGIQMAYNLIVYNVFKIKIKFSLHSLYFNFI